MNTGTFTITIHLVTSLDGIIAKRDNSTAWFDTADHYKQGVTITAKEAADFLKTIDCYVMGSHTYEHALELSKTYGWVYGDVPTIVLSHRQLSVERRNIEIYSGDLEKLVEEKLKPNFKTVWVVGGAMLAGEFIRAKLADELRVSVIPIILGDGLRLFDGIKTEQTLHLKNVTPYKSGMVELVYDVKR